MRSFNLYILVNIIPNIPQNVAATNIRFLNDGSATNDLSQTFSKYKIVFKDIK